MVTLCTTRFNIQNTHFLSTQYIMCFVWIFFTLYSVNWLVFITEMECVYCAVRTEGQVSFTFYKG
jgi:hypothetical protein